MDISSLIEKSLSGNADEAEKKKIKEWVSADHANETEFEDISLLWNCCTMADEKILIGDTFGKIRLTIQQPPQKKPLNSFLKWVTGILLIEILFLVFTFGVNNFLQTQDSSLKFDNIPLKEVVVALEKRYNLKIVIENDEILTCLFTGTFYRAHSSDEIIEILAKAMSLEYAVLDGKFRLRGKGC